jgi:hypothetical protein
MKTGGGSFGATQLRDHIANAAAGSPAKVRARADHRHRSHIVWANILERLRIT